MFDQSSMAPQKTLNDVSVKIESLDRSSNNEVIQFLKKLPFKNKND